MFKLFSNKVHEDIAIRLNSVFEGRRIIMLHQFSSDFECVFCNARKATNTTPSVLKAEKAGTTVSSKCDADEYHVSNIII